VHQIAPEKLGFEQKRNYSPEPIPTHVSLALLREIEGEIGAKKKNDLII
jgi:hypothetical protein